MRTIGAAKFKEQCLSLLDSLDAESIIITKHGRPVARLLPYEQQWADLIGSLKDKVTIKGDIFPTGVRWDAES